MVCLAFCIACVHGQHDGHIEDFAPAPEGVMGGSRCPCEGECVESYKPLDLLPAKWAPDALAEFDALVKGVMSDGERGNP